MKLKDEAEIERLKAEARLKRYQENKLPDFSEMTRAERVLYDKIREKFGNRFFTRKQAWDVDRFLGNALGMRLPENVKKTAAVIQPFLEKWFRRGRARGQRMVKALWMFHREAPLTWLEVEALRADAAKGMKIRELAEKYQISEKVTRDIVLYRSWTGAPKTGRPKGAKDLKPRKRRQGKPVAVPMISKGDLW